MTPNISSCSLANLASSFRANRVEFYLFIYLFIIIIIYIYIYIFFLLSDQKNWKYKINEQDRKNGNYQAEC